ncbi:uL15 family ribosomal protein [Patescibacteria group bacterium]
MQLHELKPKQKSKKRKRVGRGGKRGTYSGKGIKGQKSRSGRRFQPVVRELIKKYPKLRGYRFKRRKPKAVLVNLNTLEKKFKIDERVSPKTLLERKIIRRIKGRAPLVKISGQGKLTKKLTIQGCKFSKGAEEKIKKAKGVIK